MDRKIRAVIHPAMLVALMMNAVAPAIRAQATAGGAPTGASAAAASPAGAPTDPAAPPAAEEDPLAKIFGDGGFTLKAGSNGKIFSELNPETGEMEFMHVEGKVEIESELMNLKCNDLLIDMKEQKMTAKGEVVEFDKGDASGTCGRLTYDIESKKTHLEGLPRPVVRQKDASGRVRQTTADRITMIQNEQSNNVLWDGNPEFKVLPPPEEAKPAAGVAPEKREAPRKIDDANTGRLRNPALDR